MRWGDIRPLPAADLGVGRFVGERAVVGDGGSVFVHDIDSNGSWGGRAAAAVERVDPLGDGALVTLESAEGLEYLTVDLRAATGPVVRERRVLPGVGTSETRTHGFFYQPVDATHGTFGVPIVGRGPTEAGGREDGRIVERARVVLVPPDDAVPRESVAPAPEAPSESALLTPLL